VSLESAAPDAANAVSADRGDCLRIRGAREHNLKNIDLDLPRGQLIVVTGPSGSGKSSLLYDTLFAEGQRQFLESLSVTARQFMHQLQRPDVDLIDGLQPTLCIDQRSGSTNPRSTVATVTEIYDHLRVLWARLATPICPQCGESIKQQSADEILEQLLEEPAGTKLMLLAPKLRGQKGKQLELFEEIRKAGFLRARVDGAIVDVDPPPELNAKKSHTIEAVVDRIIIRDKIEQRLGESLRLAITQGGGAVIVCSLPPGQELTKDAAGNDTTPWNEELLSTIHACPTCKLSFPELEPRSFSFNSPYGACPTCEGLGQQLAFDPTLVLPNPELSLAGGANLAWKGFSAKALREATAPLQEVLPRWKVTWETPLAEWPEAAREKLWRGDPPHYAGLAIELEKELATSLEEERREELERFRAMVLCPACQGSRLRPESRAATFAETTLPQWCAQNVRAALAWCQQIEPDEDERPILEPLLQEIQSRLQFLERVGLGYLTLDRSAATLSGGELQRVRLATSIGSGLVGVCYILDEPSIGLHPRDNDRLIESIRDLQERGNTVLVVEHDEATMRAADQILDIGPGAGAHGGQIVAQGTSAEVIAQEGCLTGDYLAGRKTIPVPTTRRKPLKTQQLVIEGCTANNLCNVSVSIPLGLFVCVTGVSGSGKSTLINGTLARAIHRRLWGEGPTPGPFTSLRGVNQIQRMIRVDQSPLGKSSRSNPATYTGIYDEIRKLWSNTKEAKQRGYKASRFSFNVKGGRCETCEGAGLRRIEMNFLPDIEVPCEVCHGTRFNAATLDIRYRGLSIADALALPIEQAVKFFENIPAIAPMVECLNRVGLGYISLGQAASTLSGGEAQRIKLATELGKPQVNRMQGGHTLFLLDEPTTGLHFEDIRRLLEVLQSLVNAGNTVLVIEHNLDVIKSADWVIDMGPEGGAAGGQILCEGTPEELVSCVGSHTGAYLKGVLK